MDAHPGVRRVLVGDSITDLHGAEHADQVFARGRLSGFLDQRGIPYQPFETFVDIKASMEEGIHLSRPDSGTHPVDLPVEGRGDEL